MMPGAVSKRVIADRLGWIESWVEHIQTLPLEDEDAFFADPRNAAAAESYLRRALEALLDLGRHILAKGFGRGVTEYKEIPRELLRRGILTHDEADLLEEMAGYRNRMVHFYHEVSSRELFEICSERLGDIQVVASGLKRWIREHPECVDETL